MVVFSFVSLSWFGCLYWAKNHANNDWLMRFHLRVYYVIFITFSCTLQANDCSLDNDAQSHHKHAYKKPSKGCKIQ